MWSVKHKHCISCKSKFFNHKGLGFCSKCYEVNRKKSKLTTELKLLNTIDILNFKRPLLPFDYWKIDNKDEIISIFLKLEDEKLDNLKLYGKIEQMENNLDINTFVLIFNKITPKRRNKKYSNSNEELYSLYNILDFKQRKNLCMQLLKLII